MDILPLNGRILLLEDHLRLLLQDVLLLVLDTFLLLFDPDHLTIECLCIEVFGLSLRVHRQLQIRLLQLIPLALRLDHIVVRLAPQLAKLVKLFDLRIFYLDVAVFAETSLFAIFALLGATVAAAATRAVIAMVLAHGDPVELSVTELAICLILGWAWVYQTGRLIDRCDQGRIQRVYLGYVAWAAATHRLFRVGTLALFSCLLFGED